MTGTSTIELHRSSGDASRRAAAVRVRERRQGDAQGGRGPDSRPELSPRPTIYWADLIGVGAPRLCGAVHGDASPARRLLRSSRAIIAVLALYRAGSFIHELTHIKPNAVPGFRLVWNLIVGIPLLVPSFMYEGVHNQHHAKRYYGTVNDPEYLPLALMKPWTLPVFLIAAALAPSRHADPLRNSRAVVAAFAEAARDSRRQLFRTADQSAVPPSAAGRRVPPPVAVRWRLRAAFGRLRCWRWLRRASFRSARSSSSSASRRA